MRAERIEWFSDRNPMKPELEELLDLGLFLPLPSKDINNYQVFVIRTGVHDTRRHDQNDVLKVRSVALLTMHRLHCIMIGHFFFLANQVMKMVLDVALHLDETISIYGAVAIFDMKGVTWRHGLQMTPSIIKR